MLVMSSGCRLIAYARLEYRNKHDQSHKQRRRDLMSDERSTAARVPDPGIRALFRRDSRWQAWLDVEVALARAQAELGIIPHSAAQAIAQAARLELLDRKRIDEAARRTSHTIVPLVW
jgi:hypothetical protein